MTLPSWARRSGADSPGSSTGVEKETTASETGAYKVEYRVGGEFSPHGFIAVPDNLRVKRKKSPAVTAAPGFFYVGENQYICTYKLEFL